MPEYPPYIVILTLRFEGDMLAGDMEWIETSSASIRVNWASTSTPAGYRPIGAGVAYVHETTDKLEVVPVPNVKLPSLGGGRYRWSAGIPPQLQSVMCIAVLPEGMTIDTTDSVPTDAKQFGDRLALYWSFDSIRRYSLVWRFRPLEAPIAQELEALNRICNPTRSTKVPEVQVELSHGGRSGHETQEHHMEPLSILTAIGSTLGLVDKFVSLVRKLRSEESAPFKVEAKQEQDALVIRRDGVVRETVPKQQLNLNEWDAPRFKALQQRVASLWSQFNGMYAQLPNLSVDEQVRIKQRMDGMRKELCQDFREMVSISEKVLGVSLADHYTLYATCTNDSF